MHKLLKNQLFYNNQSYISYYIFTFSHNPYQNNPKILKKSKILFFLKLLILILFNFPTI